jgi:hypothetical protein
VSKNTSDKPERTALEVSSGIAMTLLLAIEVQIVANAATATPDELEKLVKLGDRVSGLLAECRKLEKAQGQLAQGITRELVIGWAKQQPREGRQRLIEDLIRLNDGRKVSVLA